jgi:hypothetical protein
MKVQRKETVIVTMDIELNDPLQIFGNRQPPTSYMYYFVYTNQYKTNDGKNSSEKKGFPLVPRYVGMCRTDTSKIGAQ